MDEHDLGHISEEGYIEGNGGISMIAYKLITIGILFVISFTFGYLPAKLSFLTTNSKMIGIANAFSGGIFLCVALLHLLPESNEIFEEMYNDSEDEGGSHKNRFPISFFIAILGYSLILFVEKIIFDSHPHEEHSDVENVTEEERKDSAEVEQNNIFTMENKSPQPSVILNRNTKLNSNPRLGDDTFSPVTSRLSKSRRINEYLESFKINKNNEEQFKQLFSSAGKISFVIQSKFNAQELPITKTSVDGKEMLINVAENACANKSLNTTNVSSYLLLVALSVHAGFEGIAIGLQNNPGEMFYMFLAILFHKWVEALSIGINLAKSNVDKVHIFNYILVFSLMTPCGILFGMIFAGFSDIVEAIFLSISAGTFMYISASEIVIEEFSVSSYKKEKFIGFLLGTFIITFMTLFEHKH